MKRRDFLVVGVGALATSAGIGEALANSKRPIYGGWHPVAGMGDKAPRLKNLDQQIRGTSDGKSVVLWPHYEKVTGRKFKPFMQGEFGDCCGEAGVMGAQFVSAVQIDRQKRNEEYKGPFSVEFTYASSRVEIGGGKIWRGDGSTGEWTVESMKRLGLLPRGVYGKYDLRTYNGDLGRYWGKPRIGVPDALEAIAKLHPIKTAALLSSWAEACDSIANGYPVLLCSSIGYNNALDRDGFLNYDRIWHHAMMLMGFDRRRGKRQGGCIANSWDDNWLWGPQHELGTPAGCFWADAANIDAAIKQGDSYALSEYVGYPRRRMEYMLY